MSELPCFKCGSVVNRKRATHTRDGKIACPNCTKRLGMRVAPCEGFVEIERMIDRATIEEMRDLAVKKVKDARESNPQGEFLSYETIRLTLDWVLGKSDDEPIERSP